MGKYTFDILFLVIAAIMILICAKRGFLKSVIRFARLLIAFISAYLFGGMLGGFLYNSLFFDPVYDFFYKKIEAIYNGTAAALHVDQVLEQLPDFLVTDAMRANIIAAQESGTDMIHSVTTAVATPVATLISNLTGYLFVFVVTLLLLWIGVAVLDKLIEKIAFLHKVNTLLGALWGAFAAILLLLVLSSLIKAFFSNSSVYTDSIILKFLGESAFLKGVKFLDIGSKLFQNLFS